MSLLDLLKDIGNLVVPKPYQYVDAQNLNTDQLRRLEGSDFTIVAEIIRKSGVKYLVTHHSQGLSPFYSPSRYEPLVVLGANLPIDEKDFGDVEKLIASLVDARSFGRRRGPTEPYGDHLSPEGNPILKSIMPLNERLTQERVASFIDAYSQHFGEENVRIPYACFVNTPKSNAKRVLSQENLIYACR